MLVPPRPQVHQQQHRRLETQVLHQRLEAVRQQQTLLRLVGVLAHLRQHHRLVSEALLPPRQLRIRLVAVVPRRPHTRLVVVVETRLLRPAVSAVGSEVLLPLLQQQTLLHLVAVVVVETRLLLRAASAVGLEVAAAAVALVAVAGSEVEQQYPEQAHRMQGLVLAVKRLQGGEGAKRKSERVQHVRVPLTLSTHYTPRPHAHTLAPPHPHTATTTCTHLCLTPAHCSHDTHTHLCLTPRTLLSRHAHTHPHTAFVPPPLIVLFSTFCCEFVFLLIYIKKKKGVLHLHLWLCDHTIDRACVR